MPNIWHKFIIRFNKRLVPRSESRHSGTSNMGITSSATSLAMRVVRDSKDHGSLGEQVLYHHYNVMFVSLVCQGEIHYVDAQNLKRSGHRNGCNGGLLTLRQKHILDRLTHTSWHLQTSFPTTTGYSVHCKGVGQRSDMHMDWSGFPSGSADVVTPAQLLSYDSSVWGR